EKIRTKLEKLPRLFDRLVAIEVTIDLEHRENPQVDLKVSAEHKHDFRATSQADELMAAIDGAMHKLEKQLRKYKERIVERHRGPGARPRELAEESEQPGE
ncbi:unnamed protein product, partial [marine sediment metagenome]